MAEWIVESTIEWIGSLLIQEIKVLFGVEEQVRALQEDLESMQSYLQDADSRQEEGEVRTLIRQIRKLAYDAEDVIDTYILRVRDDDWKHSEYWLMRLAGCMYSVPNVYGVGKQVEVIQKDVKRITEKLNDCGMRKITKLLERLHDERYRRQPRPPSYSHDDSNGEYVAGLEKDIRQLKQVLMGQGNVQVNILSILGMGGSGKTTLARKLYNHPYVKECFHCSAWVFISQEWKTEDILLQILRKVSDPNEKVSGPNETIQPHTKLSVEELVDKLRSILKEKSYLVVLDDVWRREALDEILPAFPRENMERGSKIIITTRNQNIITNLDHNSYTHELQPLNGEEAWELFSKLALSHYKNRNMEDFETLGKEMLRKCGGLPLAIAVLAGILNSKKSIAEWQQVNAAVRSRVMEGTQTNTSQSVQHLLALSYDDLPYDLKPCFQYLCVFPEDCQIPAGMLTRMWIAEGLVTVHNEEMSQEDVAMQILKELSHRSMIKIVRTNFKGIIKAIQLHDLLRDLCVKKAKEENFLRIFTATSSHSTSHASATTIQPRRAALHSSILLPTTDFNLRSLVLLTRSSILHSAYDSKETLDLRVVHRDFKLLRLLNLWGVKTVTGTLPAEIGRLIHLRYLGVRASNITCLPRSIGKLRNLLTLDYRNIDSDNNVSVQIPNVLKKLVLLRHLFLPIESPWSLLELQLGELKNLQTLWGVKCGEHGRWFSKEMITLSTTVKKLKVIVSSKSDLEAVFSCPSLQSDGLHTLHCQWIDGVVLQHVNPISRNEHLHKLVLVGPIRVNSKLSIMLPSNLVTLELRDSIMEGEDPMVAIGTLTHLKLLKLSNSYMGSKIQCEINSFPALEELYLESLPNLNMWKIQSGAMANLKKIEILWCRKLHQFPQGVAFVTTLQQFEFFGMSIEFNQEAEKSGWSRKGLKLPQNMEAIIYQCDSLFDISSLGKIYDQLIVGVFLNNKKQKYWLMKYNEHYYNCFMLYATYLSLHVCEDDSLGDNVPEYQKPMDSCWELSQIKESDGASIMVGKIKQSPYNTLFDVRGEFDTKYLSLGVTYKIAFVVMLPLAAPVQHKCKQPGILYLGQLGKLGPFESYEYDLNDKPRGEWIRLLVGKFKTSLANIGKMTFSLEEVEYGLVIKGVAIEPILNQEAEESGWSRKVFKLPQNMEDIIDQCDSRIDKSSISKFYDQLIVGVFLNNKKQKYWLMKYNEHYYNCFMLYATYLSLHVCEDDSLGDNVPGNQKPMDSCWEWSQMEESDGASIMVGKIERPPYNTLLSVHGEFDTKYLSLGVTYKIAFVVMLPLAAPEQHKCKQPTFCYLRHPRHFASQKYYLNDKPRGEWIRLFVGKFKTPLAIIGKMTFSLEEFEYGLVIKGVAIEPILNQEAEESGRSRKGLRMPFLTKFELQLSQNELPQNIEHIINQCDSRIDKSSISKLYDQLIVGVFLKNKKQKYWLMKYNEHYYNCFMLYATYLSLDMCEDDPLGDCIPIGYKEPMDRQDSCWEWSQIKESDGASIMVGKVNAHSFSVRGKFNTEYLSSEVTYKIDYVVMKPLAVPDEDSDYIYLQLHLCLPDHRGSTGKDQYKSEEYYLKEKPRGEWISLFVGEFKTSNIGRILTFSATGESAYGLVIKGVVIEPIVTRFTPHKKK